MIAAGLAAGAFLASAQTDRDANMSVRATAEFGLANTLSTTSSLPGITSKITSMNFGVEVERILLKKGPHSFSLNAGVGYMNNEMTSDLESVDYSYDASAAADMDGESYRRCYELRDIHQKQRMGYLTVPLYARYGYQIGRIVRLHADAGVRIGFKVTNSLSEVSGTAYSYGVYPQYDNLLINASYLNNFGESDLADARRLAPQASDCICSALVGIGAEFNIYGPMAIDVALRYNIGLTNLYKSGVSSGDFNEGTTPVEYTVAEGQSVRALCDYFTKSRLDNLAFIIGIAYRF